MIVINSHNEAVEDWCVEYPRIMSTDVDDLRLLAECDTDGEVVFAAARALTFPIFNGLPNMSRVYF